MLCAWQRHFVYGQAMDVEGDTDAAVSKIAAAIAEPVRARMPYFFMDDQLKYIQDSLQVTVASLLHELIPARTTTASSSRRPDKSRAKFLLSPALYRI